MKKRTFSDLLAGTAIAIWAASLTGLSIADPGPGAAPAGSGVLSSWSVSPRHFSPNGDGVQDTTRLEVDVSVAPVFLELRARTASGDTLGVLFADTLASTGLHRIPWEGTYYDSTYHDTLVVGESTYVDTTVIDTMSARAGNIDLLFTAWALDFSDTTGPESLEVVLDISRPTLLDFILSPEDSSLQNGQTLNVTLLWNEPVASVSAVFDSLDSAPGAGAFIQRGDSTDLVYNISAGNSRPDAADIPIEVTAADSAGNRLVTNGVFVCLSNTAPAFLEWEYLQPWRTGFHNGETVRIVTRWDTGPGVDSTDAVTADFSEMDSGASVLGQGSLMENGDFLVTYRLSANNMHPDGSYRVELRGHDRDCGLTTADIFLPLNNTRPTVVPVLDPLERSSRTAFLPVSGRAPGVFQVIARVIPEGTLTPSFVDSLAVDGSGDFSGTLTLSPGANHLVFVSMNTSGNLSQGTEEADIFLLGAAFLTVPKRFRPDDAFSIGLQEEALRATVEIRNLSGEVVTRLRDSTSDEYYEIAWDGRSKAGEVVFSGPYLALITIEYPGGERETHAKPFIFTRE